MAHAVAIAAKPAREAAQQENNQDDDEYRSKRHGTLPERPRAARKRPRGPDQSTIRAASPQVIRRIGVVCSPSLRAKRSNHAAAKQVWIASSLALPCANASRLSQAMTGGWLFFAVVHRQHPKRA